jgi:predicted N-formylglutamate amidohydrolase
MTAASIPAVCDVALVRGAAAAPGARPDLLLEVPHGATRAAHFDALRAELTGDFPAGLRDFFFVNTDVGAPEVAQALAARVVRYEPQRSVLVIRCLVPRTFIDTNRVIDAATRPADSQAGGMTPGVVSYVKEPADFALLFARYAAYRDVVSRAFDDVCGHGGTAVMVHSYAPRNVDVPVDERIVERLREAYEPDVVGTWTLRAEVDLITQAPDGERPCDEALVGRVRDAFTRDGLRVAENEAYSLHPSSMAHVYATRHPGRTLCVEMRRDLLAREFTPFAEMDIEPAKAGRMAAALASALARGAA